jgi:signal peptidase II
VRPLPVRDRRRRRVNAPSRLKESTLYRGAYLAVSLAVLFLDQWTKGIITRTMEVHQSRTIVGDVFDLTYVRNSGAAFGLFASVDSSLKAILLNSVAVIVFLVVSAYALRSSHKSVRLQVGLALILGGAVGNLLDRVRFGYVVDFLDFSLSGHHWPAFNVADSAICIGVGLLFLDMLRNEESETPRPDAVPGG